MSIKTAILAVTLLSAAALPALAEDYANDPAARTTSSTVAPAPLFGGKAASTVTVVPSGKSAVTTAMATGRTLSQYLADPAYKGGA
jgi:hypothetical protein